MQGQAVSILKIPLDQLGYLQDDYQPSGYSPSTRRGTSKKTSIPVAPSYNGGASYAGGGEEEEAQVEEGFADDNEYDDDPQYDCELITGGLMDLHIS